jgi:hypothetical protein
VTCNNSSILVSQNCDLSGTLTTNDSSQAYVRGDRVNNVIANSSGLTRMTGYVSVEGTVTSNTSFDGTCADMRFAALSGAGSIDRSVLFFTLTGSNIGNNTITFNYPFSDTNYQVSTIELDGPGAGGAPLRLANVTAASFDVVDDVGGRNFQITVQRFEASS